MPSSASNKRPKFLYKIVPIVPPLPLNPSPSTNHPDTGNPANNQSTQSSTIPEDYTLPASQLDTASGYIHLSTATQIPITLSQFFASPASRRDGIYLLRIPVSLFTPRAGGAADDNDTDRREQAEQPEIQLKWEDLSHAQGAAWEEGFYPHVYIRDGPLEVRGSEVEGVKEVFSFEGEEGWTQAVRRLGIWLV